MSVQKLQQLDAENKSLIVDIDREESCGNTDKVIALKKQLYTNKLEMISLIEIRDKRNGMTFDELDVKVNSAPVVPKYMTGIEPLDDNLGGGIEPGTFIQLAGESGAGKTTFVTEMIVNVAEANRAILFSFEMGERRSRDRIRKKITKPEQRKNIIIDFDTRNLDDLCNEIVLYANEGVRFFACDSKMKIDVPGIDEDYKKSAEISKRLSKLTQQNDIIIMLINQMSESDIKSKRLALKHGGDQKYDADIALFYVMHEKEPHKRRIVCTKNRTGDERLFNAEVQLRGGKTVKATNYETVEYRMEGVL